jgi:hypothetical protein
MSDASGSKVALVAALRRVLRCRDCESGVVRFLDEDGCEADRECECYRAAGELLRLYDAPAPPPATATEDDILF